LTFVCDFIQDREAFYYRPVAQVQAAEKVKEVIVASKEEEKKQKEAVSIEFIIIELLLQPVQQDNVPAVCQLCLAMKLSRYSFNGGHARSLWEPTPCKTHYTSWSSQCSLVHAHLFMLSSLIRGDIRRAFF
jgi:hypothetical protein